MVYSDLTLTAVAILFMRRMSGFDYELPGAVPSCFSTCCSSRLYCITIFELLNMIINITVVRTEAFIGLIGRETLGSAAQ